MALEVALAFEDAELQAASSSTAAAAAAAAGGAPPQAMLEVQGNPKLKNGRAIFK
jgi:hypothetical protein